MTATGPVSIRIETTRLVLRTPLETDLQAYLTYRNEPESLAKQHMLATGAGEARAFLRTQAELPEQATGWRMFALCPREAVEADIVGEVGVFLHPERPEGNIGWWLHPKRRGLGWATEAAWALLDWCFTVRRLHRVTAGCLADNAASAAVMMRLGMRLETRSIESRLLGDRWHDEIGYALLRREWANRAQD